MYLTIKKIIAYIAILLAVFSPTIVFAYSFNYEATGGFIINILDEHTILITDPTGNNSGFSVEHGFLENDNLILTGSVSCSPDIPCDVFTNDWGPSYSDRGDRYAMIWANNPDFPDCTIPYTNCAHRLFLLKQKTNGVVELNIFSSIVSGEIKAIGDRVSSVIESNWGALILFTIIITVIFFMAKRVKSYLK